MEYWPYLHCVHVKCIHPPRVNENWKRHCGQRIPFSAKCLANLLKFKPVRKWDKNKADMSELMEKYPSAWYSGSLASFHSANLSHVKPSCCFSHYATKIKSICKQNSLLTRHPLLTGLRQDAQVTARQSGHISRFWRGLAIKPEEH